MPAWFYVIAVAAVLFVAWVAFARRWAHALWYSWTRARHLADLTQTEVIPGAEYLPYAPVGGSPPWPLANWREQTRVELAPETLDLLAAPADPGPGGDARLSTTPPPGPDHQYGSEAELVAELERQGWFDPERSPAREPSRLADAGDVTAAHVAHPAPDWLACQMAQTFAWVRGMVPQVTGWSVGA